MPAISLITPTADRASLLPHTYALLRAQTIEDWEWLVLCDPGEDHPFLEELEDPRVRCFRLSSPCSLGSKRNELVGRASAELIAHIDDDDFYAPGYLERMIAGLGQASLAKVADWPFLDVRTGFAGRWPYPPETLRTGDIDAVTNTIGFGFSYVYRRAYWVEHPFPDVSWNEDAPFAAAALARGEIVFPSDARDLVVHIVGHSATHLRYDPGCAIALDGILDPARDGLWFHHRESA